MAKPSLKDLRTTYRVLTGIGTDVPQSLLVSIAERIKAEEKSRKYRKIARMSEEELIRYQSVPRRKLRINLPDGRIIQEKTNEQTFYAALREGDFSQMLAMGLMSGRKPVFIGFCHSRKMLVGYKMLHESCFVLRSIKPEERVPLLQRIDQTLHLNWDIELIS